MSKTRILAFFFMMYSLYRDALQQAVFSNEQYWLYLKAT